MKATSDSDVCRDRRRRDQPVDRNDRHTTQKRLEFETTVQERTRELAATGSVIFHPDHQELHLPKLALTTAGHRVAQRRRQRGGGPVRPGRGDDQGSAARRAATRRWTWPAPSASTATSRSGAHRSARAQRRPGAGRGAAAAESRLQRPAHRRRDDRRARSASRTSMARSRSPTADSRATSTSRSSRTSTTPATV